MKEIVLFDLINIRKAIFSIFVLYLSEPKATLLSGIVFGWGVSFRKHFYNEICDLGLIHVLVASGSNLYYVKAIVEKLLKNSLKKVYLLTVASLAMLFYVVFSGFQLPIIRAYLMLQVSYIMFFIGYRVISLISLLVVAYVMLFVRPNLLFELSFQLSFLSALGLILFSARVKRLMDNLYKGGLISLDVFSETVSALLLVLPILILNFERFNFLLLITNFLVLFLVPYLFLLGLLLIILSKLSLGFAYLLSYVIDMLLDYLLLIIDIFSKISFLSFEIRNKVVFLFLYACFLLVFIWRSDV